MANKSGFLKALRDPIWGARRLKRKTQRGFIERQATPNEGKDFMSADWDNLIVLDACRYDSFKKHNPIEGKLSKVKSRGETTQRYIRENFADRTFYDTVYVCGNAAVGNLIEDVDVFKFIGLWTDQTFPDLDRTYRDVVPPELVVEKTREMNEKYPNKRLIAHFLQPHPPFVVRNGENIEKGSPYRDFTAARKGEMSREEITAVYEENVSYVLEHVADLVDSLGGKTVVTADHGELLGEGVGLLSEIFHYRWKVTNRRHFDYAHYDYVRVPELINVPWLEIPGERREIVPAESPEGIEMDESIVEDRLEALGYR